MRLVPLLWSGWALTALIGVVCSAPFIAWSRQYQLFRVTAAIMLCGGLFCGAVYALADHLTHR